MLIVKKENSCYIVLWDWKISLYSKADIRAVEATAEGKSIFAYDKGGKVAAAYEQWLF